MFGRALFGVLVFALGCGHVESNTDSHPEQGGTGGTHSIVTTTGGSVSNVAGAGGALIISTGAGGSSAPGLGGTSSTDGDPAMCNDADGDGIWDEEEGANAAQPALSRDTDLDGTPDYLDADSDGDGISDADETGNAPCKPPRDTDNDKLPDYVDLDSDGDGISDADEQSHGLNPLAIDSDGDGCFDSLEPLDGPCRPESNRAVPGICPTNVAQSRLVLHVDSSFTEPIDSALLEVSINSKFATGAPKVTLTPVDVSPTDGAAISEGQVRALKPGVDLGVIVQLEPGVRNVVVEVRVTSAASGAVVARGKLIDLLLNDYCQKVGAATPELPLTPLQRSPHRRHLRAQRQHPTSASS